MTRTVESTAILFVPESLDKVRYVLRRKGAGGDLFLLILLVDYVQIK